MLGLFPGSATCVCPCRRNSSYLHNLTSAGIQNLAHGRAVTTSYSLLPTPFLFPAGTGVHLSGKCLHLQLGIPTSFSAHAWDCQSLSISYSSAFAFSCISWGVSPSFQWLSGFLIRFVLFFLCCLLGTKVETPLPSFSIAHPAISVPFPLFSK